MSFAELELDDELLEALTQMGHTRPTLIQQEVVPTMLEGRDVLASAPTGTGKTLAFLLPAVQHLLDSPRRHPGPGRILVLTPTRELALQVAEQARQLTQFTGHQVIDITGGVHFEIHAEQLKGNVDIVVATPGRLIDYINAETFDCHAVEWFILDEADRMLDMGFIKEMRRVAGELSARTLTALFSATLEGSGLENFAHDVMNEPVLIGVEPPRRERGKILELLHFCDDLNHKRQILCHYLNDPAVERCVVFVKTRERLKELVEYLQSKGVDAAYLRGEMAQDKRNDALGRFRQGEVKVLIATDVAARGLDVPEISHVFNYDLPRSADVYVHRIGRTARAGRKGIAINLIEAHDVSMMQRIERYTQNPVKRRVIDSLRPTHRVPVNAPKKHKPKTTAEKKAAKAKAKGREKKNAKRTTTAKPKNRLRDRLQKGAASNNNDE
jgi:ATP-dependent RNA helicase SrmB